MKKSVGSLIALNRNLIVVLAVILGVAAAGFIAWQARAESGTQRNSKISSSEPAASTRNLPTGVEPVSAGAKAPSVEPRAQDAPRGVYRGVQTAVKFDVSPPLRTMKGSPVTGDLGDMREFEERNTGNEGQLGPQDIDKTVQMFVGGEGPNVMPTPIVSFDSGIGCGGCQPPDPNGDVGPNHFVAMGNTQFQIFNKTGTSLLGPTNSNALWAGFGGPCQSENAGDPVVLYDQLDDRWILTQFTAAGPTFFNCVAVSTTPDPTGTYFRYAFTTGTNFPDYPKYGMWNDALYISTREFAGGPFAGVGAYAVNRAQMIAGNPAAQLISFLATPAGAGGAFNVGDGLVPSDLDGMALPPAGAPNYFIGSMDLGGPYGAPSDALNIWKFHADFVTPANSTFTLTNVLPVAPFDTVPAFCAGRSCIPQPGTANLIDHLGYRQRPLFRAAYRNFGSHESLVTNQSVEASPTMSGIRWWEIRNLNSAPVLFQDATYAPGTTDGIHRWMGSIAMDTVGNIALGFSASAATVTFPSSWYTGRLANDPVNTMPQGEASVVNGAASQTSGQRWGDYTDMVVDPVDDCTFWYTNEYIPAGGAWRMRIGSFKFPSCSLGPNFSLSVTPTLQDICAPANGVYTVNTTSISGFTTPIVLTATGNPPGTTVNFSPNPVIPGNSSTMTVGNTAVAAPGTYTINVLGTAGALTQNQNVTLKLTTASPSTPTLTAPANGSTGQLLQPTFTWTASTQAATYTLEIATDAGFANIVHTANGLTTTTYNGATLSSLTQYFWRVRGINTCGTGQNSPAFSFTTALVCIVPFSNTAPITINDNLPASPYPSNITVSGLTGTVTKVTVDLNGWSHTFPDDVDIMVVGPGGQNTLLSSDAGGSLDIVGVNLTLDDAAAATLPDGTQISSGTFRPGNYDTTSDVFPAPAPAPGATVAMSVFNGTNPNGTWSLYVRDDLGVDVGSISGGWTVRIETANCGGSPTPTSTGSPAPTATSTATATNTATPTASPSCTPGPANFSNPAAITINDNLPASPYPSDIPVAGLTGTVTKVTVDLTGMSHTFPDDVDIMLVGPAGQNTLLMSDAGGSLDIVSVNLTLDDAAAAALPDATQIASGTFRPANYDTTSDVFPAPAPVPGATVGMSVFNGSNPNGTWSLYVRDDLGVDVGSISGGWALHITTTTGGCGTPTATSTGTPATATATNTPTNTPTATATATASPSPGGCSFSNGGLNPQMLTESGVAAPAGFFWSEVQHNTGNLTESNNVSGFSGSVTAAATFRLADDFTITQPCTINSVALYSYQTGAPASPSPFTAYTLQIWNGRPGDPGSVVVFGDTTTNRLASSVDTTYFRIFNTVVPPPGTVQGTTRKIWRNTVTVGTTLPAGTYWLDWNSTVTASAAHFDPSKTISGSRGAAGDNGRQLTVSTGVWADAIDTGNPAAAPDVIQDFPFDVIGSGGGPTSTATATPTMSPSGTPIATFTATSTATATATATVTGTPCPPSNFSNPAAITINDNLPASPYPSDIPVAGLTGTVTKVTVDLTGMSHTFPDDVDIMLVGPGGQNTLLMSDAGGSLDIVSVNLTLDDAAAAALPDATQIASGTFRPANYDTTSDVFPAPAPVPGATVGMSVFNGSNPNGTWSLYVRDDLGVDVGSISGGWALHITTTNSCGTPLPTSTSTVTGTATATPTASPSCSPGGGQTLTEDFAVVPVPGWFMQNNSVPVGSTGWFQGNDTVFPAQAGATTSYIGANFNNTTGTNTISNWLLTPALTLQNGAVMTFWTRTTTANPFPDRLQVRMSTNGSSTNVGTLATDVGDFTTMLLDINPTYQTGGVYPEVWTQFTVNITGVAAATQGRLAFRYFVENGGPTGANSNYIGIDTFTFTGVGGACASPTATATATGTPATTSVQFSSATYTEDESQTAAITITRTGDTTGTTTVNFATSNGTAAGGAACTSGVDYISVAQAVIFAPGETTRVVSVQICGDTLVEPTQTVNLTLTGGNVGMLGTAVLSINDTANVFRNGTSICTTLGQPASPYPSTIVVSGGPVQVGSMRVTFYDLAHTVPDHMDFLLVSPAGRQMILQSDAGGNLDLVTPVTLTFSDAAGQVLPDSAPLTTGVFEPTSWVAGQASFTAPAPPAPYNEPGSTVGGTPSLLSIFGLTNSNGTWSLYMRDDAGLFDAPTAITGCVNGGWGIEFLSSTAAQASISGRVTTANGNGIRNATVTITGNSLSEPLIATTGSFGYFAFEGLATGETYVVTVNARRYTFSTPSRVISLVDNVADADFIADPQE